jgi:hypothetical protein
MKHRRPSHPQAADEARQEAEAVNREGVGLVDPPLIRFAEPPKGQATFQKIHFPFLSIERCFSNRS